MHFAKDIFIDYFRVHNSARTIDALPSAKTGLVKTGEHQDRYFGWMLGSGTGDGGRKVTQERMTDPDAAKVTAKKEAKIIKCRQKQG